jgi:hypothetical protein
MSLVALPLAHPLTADQVEQVGGSDVRVHTAGETIFLPSAGAMTLIRAGWAQVDPNDQQAVAAALAVTQDPAAAHGAADPGAAVQGTSRPAAAPHGATPAGD